MTVALYYDPDGYVEQLGPSPRTGDGPSGLMGRQVAGHQFLDAYLTHAAVDTLTAVVRSRNRAGLLIRLCDEHSSRRRLSIFAERELVAPVRPFDLLHLPNPPDARLAWLRRAAAPFALSGVTHTLATPTAVRALCDLVLAPFMPFDALICTSQAVADMVRAVVGHHCDYLRDRFGGRPELRVRLPVIPLGVNPDKFRPATLDERTAARSQLGILPHEVVLLCVGRLSHHAKAHPFPVLHAAEQAARRTGQAVHLLFAGWASNAAVAEAYPSAATTFAPSVRVTFADGQNPHVRANVWPAADVFVSLPDNIQETFGLVVVEAMASGLPVVGSDWNGYRDLIADGDTGFLVPTRMVPGATAGLAEEVETGAVNYDHFLAGVMQTVAVDPAAAADAVTRLVADPTLRRTMGAVGRERAVERFAWKRVIRAYEQLWADQTRELIGYRGTATGKYPPVDVAFAGYPSAWVADDVVVRVPPTADLATFLTTPLTNLSGQRRVTDAVVLADLLRNADGMTVGELVARLRTVGASDSVARATVGWLLKYGRLTTSDANPERQ